MRGTKRVGKPRVFRSWICKRGQSELSDSAETLQFARTEQARNDRIFFAFECDEPMYGIT
jgi:hypothetical protein